MPKISVIVPVYKVEPYLRRCVDSILAQTFTDFELILVDDGSPDGCPAICDEYAKMDDRVRVIHKANGGLSDARNAGLDVAVGEFISFVDSDDWVAECYLEYLYRAILDGNADISICSFQKVTDEVAQDSKHIYQMDGIISGIDSQYKLFSKKRIDYIISCAKLYRADLFYGIRFPFGKQHEDEFITYQLLFRAKRIVRVKSIIYYYYQHSESIMGGGFTVKSLDSIEAFLERQDFYKTRGLVDLALKQSELTEYTLVNYRNKYAEKEECVKKRITFLYRKLIWKSYGIWRFKYFLIRILDLYCHSLYIILYCLTHRENNCG